jgi:hypothetical protein
MVQDVIDASSESGFIATGQLLGQINGERISSDSSRLTVVKGVDSGNGQ